MDAKELLKKVRKIQFKTKQKSQNLFAGEYHSAFKGQGMSFAEVRQYQIGDEVRNIDWNVSARKQETYIKVFEEERERSLFLLIDISPSTLIGSQSDSKRERIAELVAVLAFSALSNKDKVGALFFSDKVEKFLPAQKGQKQILRIIRDVLELEATGKGTDLQLIFKTLQKQLVKSATLFVISDFLDHTAYQKSLSHLAQKHEVFALNVWEVSEMHLPAMGWIHYKNAETGETFWLNTQAPATQQKWKTQQALQQEKTALYCKKAAVPMALIDTATDYYKTFIQLLKK